MAIHTYNEVSKTITYNGISSADVGVVVETFPNYNYPARQTESVHVPGLNGDILLDDGTYQNVQRIYRVSAYRKDVDFHRIAVGVVNWLHPSAGYHRLEDEYDPRCYRMATVIDEGEFANMFDMAGTGTITFNCKPQRFLKVDEGNGQDGINLFDYPVSGENYTYKVTNAGSFESHPRFKLSIASGKQTQKLEFTVTSSSGITRFNILGSTTRASVIYIDSEMQDAYYVDSNGVNRSANNLLELPDNRFPTFGTGITKIGMTQTVRNSLTRLEALPRWWTL